MNVDSGTKVGQIAVKHPLSTRIFARYGIDFCCGGAKPLSQTCEEKGLDTEAILEELRAEIAAFDSPVRSWEDAPLPELIEHIVRTYHRPLDDELPRLEFMARKVHRVHGEKMPEVLQGILDTFLMLKDELEEHMVKEEQILFPMIADGMGAHAHMPISVMLHEHDDAGEALKQLRELTSNYQLPKGACNTWRALWFGLAALETELMEHIHLENNVLFPRALAG